MGYVHDTQMSQWIAFSQCAYSAGTWTPTLASNVASNNRTAADANFNIFIPVRLPSNGAAYKGAYLKSIDVYYSVATAALDDLATVELEKIVMAAATGSAPTGSAPAISLDAGHDTAAERKATGEHKMTVTLTTPVWVDDDDHYVLYMACDAAATSVFKLYGARANYTFRI